MDVYDAIDVFMSHARVEKGLAENTLEAYGRDLAELARSLERQGVGEVGDVRTHHVLSHLVELSRRKVGIRSQARHLVAVRQLFKFLLRERAVVEDPAATIEMPRPVKELPSFLDLAEVERLLQAPDGASPR